MLYLILGFLVFVALTAFFMLLFRYYDERIRLDYQALYNDEYYKKDSGECPTGCNAGVCQSDACYDHKPPNPKCCAFDFQCKHCKGGDGEPFAKIYEEIKREYQKYQDKEETRRLNDRIFDENLYIAQINKYLRTQS